MNCPICGSVLLQNEICPCQENEIRKRDRELRMERMEEERRIQEEEARAEQERQDRARIKKEAAEKLKKSAKNLSGDVANSYREVLSGPFSALRDFLTEEKYWQSKVLFFIYLLLHTISLSLLFTMTNISYFLGSKGQIANHAFFKIFITVLILDGLFSGIKIVLANIFTNREADSDFSETLILYSSCLVFIIPTLLVSCIIGLFFPSLAFILVIFSYFIKGLTIYNIILFKTKKFDFSVFSAMIIFAVYTIPQYIVFSIAVSL